MEFHTQTVDYTGDGGDIDINQDLEHVFLVLVIHVQVQMQKSSWI